MISKRHRITSCLARSDYFLELSFDDGVRGRVYLGNLLELGAFKLWRDLQEFLKVSIDPVSETVVWDGGVRLDPEILYRDVLAKQASDRESVARDAAFGRFMARVLGKGGRRGSRGSRN